MSKELEEMIRLAEAQGNLEISKVQEKSDKEIAFDLINIKNVDIKLLKWAYPSVEAYNVKVREQKDYWSREELIKEEFEFIGRLAGAK